MCFGFWFPSFREALDVFAGALEPWNTHSQGKWTRNKAIIKTVSSVPRNKQKHRRLDIYSDLLREIQQSNVVLRMKET